MQLVASRSYPFLDSLSLEERTARDCLFRVAGGTFLLYMKTQNDAEESDHRLIHLDCRAALLWLNACEDEFGKEWCSRG
jgi:hypothetical protein